MEVARPRGSRGRILPCPLLLLLRRRQFSDRDGGRRNSRIRKRNAASRVVAPGGTRSRREGRGEPGGRPPPREMERRNPTPPRAADGRLRRENVARVGDRLGEGPFHPAVDRQLWGR
ncbi:unnamed protein product [Lampetra planeri]